MVLAGAAVTGIIAGVLIMLAGIDRQYPAGVTIARVLGLVATSIDIAAYVLAAMSLYRPSFARQTGLRQAVVIAAVAASFGMIGNLIITAVDAAHRLGGARVASDVFGMLANCVTLAALVVAFLAFGAGRTQDWLSRDRRLGQAALVLTVSYFCGFIADLFDVITYAGSPYGGFMAGLTIGVFAQIIGLGGVAVTAHAFLRQTGSRNASNTLARVRVRDLFLGISAGVFCAAQGIGVIAGIVTAVAVANESEPGKTVASYWFGAVHTLVALGTYVCLALAFLLARNRSSQPIMS